MTCITDIITKDGKFRDENDINKAYNIQLKLLEYQSLIRAIHKKWKKC
jgi:hypothetical protein